MKKSLNAHAKILKTGPGNSIQDLGRSSASLYGVPVSGASDLISAGWVNHILRNPPTAAVLEITQPGFLIEFQANTRIAWAGAKAQIILNGDRLNKSQHIYIKPKDKLEIGKFENGAKFYLGIQNGIQSQEILDSKSFYHGITEKSFLSKGDMIPYQKMVKNISVGLASAKWSTDWFEDEYLDFFPGPDFVLLSESLREFLLNEFFTISDLSSRMGIVLEEILENSLPELPTNPVFPGFVQLTSGGKLILLGPDAQVTGGYPRIMILTQKAQAILAQKRTKQKIRFRKITF